MITREAKLKTINSCLDVKEQQLQKMYGEGIRIERDATMKHLEDSGMATGIVLPSTENRWTLDLPYTHIVYTQRNDSFYKVKEMPGFKMASDSLSVADFLAYLKKSASTAVSTTVASDKPSAASVNNTPEVNVGFMTKMGWKKPAHCCGL